MAFQFKREALGLVLFGFLLVGCGGTRNGALPQGKVNNNTAIGAWNYSSGRKPWSRFYHVTKGHDYTYDLTVSVRK